MERNLRWIAVAGLLVFFFNAFGQSWQVFDTDNSDIPSDRVNAITHDIYNNIWVGTDWGLAKYDGSNWELFQFGNSPIPDNDIRALASDDQGRIWIGTFLGGLIIKDGSTWTEFNTGNSPLPADQVRCITIDDAGIAWIGTVEGVAWYDGMEWRIYNDQDVSYNGLELPGNNIADIAIRDDGLACIGTLNAGFTYLSDTSVTVFTTFDNGLPDNTALGVAIDDNGERWAACPAGGLLRHSGPYESGVWLQYSTLSSGIPTNSLNDVVIDQNDTKIIATQASGVTFYSGLSTWTTFNEANSDLPDDAVLTVHLDSMQVLWAGTENGGLARYDHISHIREISKFDLWLYPTITNQFFTIKASSVLDHMTYSIIDLSGRVVRSGKITDSITVCNVSALSSGSYMFHVSNKGQSQILRFQRL